MRALAAAGHAPELVDIRETPLEEADFERFFEAFGAELLNRRSTTWRGLDAGAAGRRPGRAGFRSSDPDETPGDRGGRAADPRLERGNRRPSGLAKPEPRPLPDARRPGRQTMRNAAAVLGIIAGVIGMFVGPVRLRLDLAGGREPGGRRGAVQLPEPRVRALRLGRRPGAGDRRRGDGALRARSGAGSCWRSRRC